MKDYINKEITLSGSVCKSAIKMNIDEDKLSVWCVVPIEYDNNCAGTKKVVNEFITRIKGRFSSAFFLLDEDMIEKIKDRSKALKIAEQL